MTPRTFPNRSPAPAPLAVAVRSVLAPAAAGFGLLETVLTLAAGAGLLVAVAVAYDRTATTEQVARAAQDEAATAQAVRRVYASARAPAFAGLTASTALARGVYPPSMLTPTAAGGIEARHPWGGLATVAATPDAAGFRVRLAAMPAKACAPFLAAATGWDDALVNGKSVRTGPGKLDPTQAAEQCAQGAADVDLVYTPPPPANVVVCSTAALPPQSVLTQTANCAPGTVLPVAPWASSWPQTATRDPYCDASGNVSWTPPTPWTPERSCAALCEPASGADASVFACPTGQIIATAGPSQYAPSAPQSTPWAQTCATPIGPLGPRVPGVASPSYACAPACVAPASSTTAAAVACPAGQLDGVSPYSPNGITRTTVRTWTCPAPVGAATYTDAVSDVNRCVPACGAPAPTSATRSATCTAPLVGGWTQTQTTTWTCPLPVGAPTSSVSPWAPLSAPPGACAPACVPHDDTETGAGTCAAPLVGTWPQTRTVHYTCPAPTGPAVATSATPWTPATAPAGACAATCSPYDLPDSRTPACSSGTGTWTQTRTKHYTCPAPTGPAEWTSSTPWTPASEPPSCAPTCSWGTAPTGAPSCPAPYASTPQTGSWGHGAACPSWVWTQTGACPVCTHTANPYPTTQPGGACPANPGGWVQTRTCLESACPAAGGPTTWSCGDWSPSTAPASCTAPPAHVWGPALDHPSNMCVPSGPTFAQAMATASALTGTACPTAGQTQTFSYRTGPGSGVECTPASAGGPPLITVTCQ